MFQNTPVFPTTVFFFEKKASDQLLEIVEDRRDPTPKRVDGPYDEKVYKNIKDTFPHVTSLYFVYDREFRGEEWSWRWQEIIGGYLCVRVRDRAA